MPKIQKRMCNVNGRKFRRDTSVETSPGQHKSANSVEVLHLQISSDSRRLTSALVLKSLWSVHLHVSSSIQTCRDRRPLALKSWNANPTTRLPIDKTIGHFEYDPHLERGTPDMQHAT